MTDFLITLILIPIAVIFGTLLCLLGLSAYDKIKERGVK